MTTRDDIAWIGRAIEADQTSTPVPTPPPTDAERIRMLTMAVLALIESYASGDHARVLDATVAGVRAVRDYGTCADETRSDLDAQAARESGRVLDVIVVREVPSPPEVQSGEVIEPPVGTYCRRGHRMTQHPIGRNWVCPECRPEQCWRCHYPLVLCCC